MQQSRLFFVALLAIGFNIWFFRPSKDPSIRKVMRSAVHPAVIPQEGYGFNDTQDAIPGYPNKTISLMKLLYQKMIVFKNRHGRLPVGTDLDTDMMGNLSAYGMVSKIEVARLFRNPDNKYADLYHDFPQPETVDSFLKSNERPDGSPVGGPKPPGTRDVLAFSNIYFHRNERTFPDGHWTANPVGFYLVLWEDGQVEKIPHDEVRYAYPQRAPFNECFPGQAGAPRDCLTYEENKKQIRPLNPDGSNPNVILADGSHPKS